MDGTQQCFVEAFPQNTNFKYIPIDDFEEIIKKVRKKRTDKFPDTKEDIVLGKSIRNVLNSNTSKILTNNEELTINYDNSEKYIEEDVQEITDQCNVRDIIDTALSQAFSRNKVEPIAPTTSAISCKATEKIEQIRESTESLHENKSGPSANKEKSNQKLEKATQETIQPTTNNIQPLCLIKSGHRSLKKDQIESSSQKDLNKKIENTSNHNQHRNDSTEEVQGKHKVSIVETDFKVSDERVNDHRDHRPKKTRPYSNQNSTPNSLLTKITTIQESICNTLKEIGVKLEKSEASDVLYDFTKRQKRFDEFFIRFGRNNLYQIRRIIDEITVYNNHLTFGPNNELTLKVFNMFKLMERSLISFHRNMVNMDEPDNLQKLEFLLNETNCGTMSSIKRHIFDKNDALTKAILEETTDTLNIIQTKFSEHRKLIKHKKANYNATWNKKLATEMNLKQKFSMYDTQHSQKTKKIKQIYGVNMQNVPSKTSQNHSSKQKTPKIRSRRDPTSKSKYQIKEEKISTVIENINVDNENLESPKMNISPINSKENIAEELTDRENGLENSKTVYKLLELITQNQIRELFSKILSSQPNENAAILLNALSNTTDCSTIHKTPNNTGMFGVLKTTNNPVIDMNTNDEDAIVGERVTAAVSVKKSDKFFGSSDDRHAIVATTSEDSSKFVGNLVGPIPSGCTVNSEKTKEEKRLFSKNVQYVYIKCMDQPPSDMVSIMNTEIPIDDIDIEKPKDNKPKENKQKKIKCTVKLQEKMQSDMKRKLERIKEIKSKLIKSRTRYIKHQSKNALYVNENFDLPWKVVSKISENIVEDIFKSIKHEVDFGEERFIKDFVHRELN